MTDRERLERELEIYEHELALMEQMQEHFEEHFKRKVKAAREKVLECKRMLENLEGDVS